jgi:Ner family transcriptional regulator
VDNTAHKISVPADWHPADIKAALTKKGYSFAQIARAFGYSDGSPNAVLHRPWSQMERIISKIIGVPAAVVWPSRYDRKGRPLKSRTARVGQKRTISKHGAVRNV